MDIKTGKKATYFLLALIIFLGLTWAIFGGTISKGKIVAWGDNYWSQCTVPSPNSGFIAVAAGTNHSLGLKSDSTIIAWGNNTYGQCNVPSPNSGFVAIAAASFHSLGLK
jgi:alpha-tubulin suppressor-like RCC1 family protein